TVCERGFLRIHTERVGRETTFGRILRLVEEAEAAKAPVQRFADRFTAYYIPVVVTAAGLSYLVGRNPTAAVAVVLVACSCAIAMATPHRRPGQRGAGGPTRDHREGWAHPGGPGQSGYPGDGQDRDGYLWNSKGDRDREPPSLARSGRARPGRCCLTVLRASGRLRRHSRSARSGPGHRGRRRVRKSPRRGSHGPCRRV